MQKGVHTGYTNKQYFKESGFLAGKNNEYIAQIS